MPSPSPRTTLTIFAASSLQDAIQELTAAFEQRHPALAFRSNYASSAQLAIQLNQGAQTDLFASADSQQMAFALEQIPSNPEPIVFATNRLTLLVPKENPADIQRVHDLARPGVRLVLAVPGTPLRSYSDELIDKLAGQFEDGHLLRDQIMANLASEEDNARQVVAKIALGEADAAFVYSSDAHSQLAQDSIEIELPAGLQVQASYPLVNLAEGENYRWTDQFIQFILSPAGQAILSKWGFGPKDES